jgi:uncharacterized membrane protein
MSVIQNYISQNQEKVFKLKNKFEKELRAEVEKLPYIEEFSRDKSGMGTVYFGLFIVSAALAGLFGLYTWANYKPIVLGIGPPLIFLGLSILRLSRIGKKATIISQCGINMSALWVAFSKYLDDFTSLKEKEFPELRSWEKYLVYAAALGKSKKHIQELAFDYPVQDNQITNDDLSQHKLLMELLTGGSLLTTIENIQVSTYSANPSSGSGEGGGFSSSGGSTGSGSSGSGFR